MFSAVSSQSNDRIRQASLLLSHAKLLESQNPQESDELVKVQKGLVFVALYSSIEFSVTASVSNLLTLIQANPQKPLAYRKHLLCSLLNSELNAVTNSGKKNIWSKKADLFDRIFSETPVIVDNAVFPTDGINIGYSQLEEIWTMFHLPLPVLPDGVYPLLLNQIKEHRNAIAHGREKAASIGGRFTTKELERQLRDVDLLCSHIIGSFDELFSTQKYLEDIV